MDGLRRRPPGIAYPPVMYVVTVPWSRLPSIVPV
jgi:hypothetical protein